VATGGTGPSGGPEFRDVLGVLESASETAWVIRARSGPTVVDPTSVHAAVVVPDLPRRLRTASEVDADTLELIAAEGWQGLEQERLGNWLMRAAGGYTGRANSVLPVGDPGIPLTSALTAVSAWYDARGLPPQIQVPLPAQAELDTALADLGWTAGPPVDVMVTDVARLSMTSRPAASTLIDVRTVPDAAWLAAFRYGDRPLPAELTQMMTNAEHPVFVSAREADGATVAIARGALTPQWLGITAVEVVAHRRRQGLGHQVIGALAEYAAALSTRHVYLQVAQDNAPALGLYRQLGFARHHSYHYRRAPLREGTHG
jgi:GNAT superfamily N-acetyltransferase